MDNEPGLRERIMHNLTHKANLQQKVFDNTSMVFDDFKKTLHEMTSELNDDLEDKLSEGVKIEYRDRGRYEAQLLIASDVLIFSMHTNVFQFNREHEVWHNKYVTDRSDNSYCGMINIYNCLADSLKHNRSMDEAYLIGRVFINHEMCYFVEGKRQDSVRYDQFGRTKIDKDALVRIIESSVDYALDFDLLVPPYEGVKILSVEQLNTKNEHAKMQTGKRMGFGFLSDDV